MCKSQLSSCHRKANFINQHMVKTAQWVPHWISSFLRGSGAAASEECQPLILQRARPCLFFPKNSPQKCALSTLWGAKTCLSLGFCLQSGVCCMWSLHLSSSWLPSESFHGWWSAAARGGTDTKPPSSCSRRLKIQTHCPRRSSAEPWVVGFSHLSVSSEMLKSQNSGLC